MTSLKRKISDEIHRFDFISIILLLQMMGYHQDQIFFRSDYSLCSQPSLLADIEFRDVPAAQVIIHVNLGLLSVQSTIPSYFFKKLDQGVIDSEAFTDFLAFFDQHLLRKYVLSLYPEINPEVFPDWKLAKSQFAGMLKLRSCSTLHWLFSLIFPELGVRAEKALLSRKLEGDGVVLGKASLDGSCVFSKRAGAPVHGLRVTLTSDEERTNMDVPWPREISERMESMIFPLLRRVGIDLEVFLIIRSRTSWARLHPESYLGYDMLKGGKVQLRRVPVYSGCLVE